MSKSIRVDTNSLISGAVVIGDRGLGVSGSSVPSTGAGGPGYIYPSLNLPADANNEYIGLIVSPPSAGTFFANEDTSATLTGASTGIYPFTVNLIENGISLGNFTSYFYINTPIPVNLVVANSVQSNTSTSVTITRVNNLVVSNSTQSNFSNSVSISQTVNLISVASLQLNSCSTGTISISSGLQATSCVQNNTSSTGAISVFYNLQGSNSTQQNSCTSGFVYGPGLGIPLDVSQSTQSNYCFSGPIQVLPPVFVNIIPITAGITLDGQIILF